MKKLLWMSVVGAVSLPVLALAEGKGNQDWAEKAAQGYEKKAEMAAKSGDQESAHIYRRMAQIKRDAGAANKAGKDFSWDEYHKLNAKLNSGHAKHVKDHKKHKKHDKMHEKHKKHGDGFLDTAEKYEHMSKKAMEQGNAEKARIYMEMAQIKRQASAANKAGKGFNWDRYEELNKRLHKEHPKKHDHVKKDDHAKKHDHVKKHDHAGPKDGPVKGSDHLE